MPNNLQPLSNNSGACYLVTGAAGFIASKVCEQLLEAGHTVVGIDNLNDYYDVRLKLYRLGQLMRQAGASEAEVKRYGLDVMSGKVPVPLTSNSELLTLKFGRFTFHKLDIEDLPALERVFAATDFSAVFNLAARAGVRYSLEFPELYRRTNVLGEENVLKCQVKYGVKKHILASSSSVYAGCPMPFVEDAVLGKMQSPYAETKRQAELLALDYHRRHGLDVTVLRYFTVFGPAGRPDMAPFRFIKWIDEGTLITLYGDGSQARDFTYVDDIARGTVLAGQLFGGRMADGGGQTADGGQRTEAGGRMAEDRGQRTEDGGRTTEGGRRMAEVGSQPSDVSRRTSALSRQPSVVSRQSSEVSGQSGTSGFRSQVSVEAPSFDIINLGGGNNPLSITAMIGMIEEAINEGGEGKLSDGSYSLSGSAPNNQEPSTKNRRVRAVIQHHPASAADMKQTWADITKAKRLLGWSPEISSEVGFRRAVDWHLGNRDWLAGIEL